MELLHYSACPLTTPLKPMEQNNQADRVFKPFGFWVSVGDSWKQWCELEGFGLNRLKHITKVTLKPDHNVLVLSTPLALDKFTRQYGIVRFGLDDHFINWEQVATEYDGIIIAPYIWQRRLSLMWYNPWICASGCIWNTDILTLENAP